MGVWAQLSDVSARLPWLSPIDTTSSPTAAQVESWIDDAEALLRNELRGAGLGATYAGDAVAELRTVVLWYVEAQVRQARDATGLEEPNDDGFDQLARWDRWIEDLRRHPERAALRLEGGVSDRVQGLRSYVTHNSDGKTAAAGDFRPRFTKDEVF